MSARKLKQVFPSVLFLAAALAVMVIGIRNDDYFLSYAMVAIFLAIVGLLLVMSLCSKKYHQELNAAKRKVKARKPKDDFFGKDQYGLFKKDPSSGGSLDDLEDNDINKKL